MASERSCSVTTSDHRVASQYHSFVIFGGSGDGDTPHARLKTCLVNVT